MQDQDHDQEHAQGLRCTRIHQFAATQIGISRQGAIRIAWAGFAVPLALAFGMWLPTTAEWTRWFVQGERHPVEIITAIALFSGGFLGISLTRGLARAKAGKLPVCFFGFFTFALFLVGLEEISWGQWIYRFATPESIAAWNLQNEATLTTSRDSRATRITYGWCSDTAD